ncbi:MAG: hypothetical protein HC925_03110 [Coleofasciculaceae cyanobacterium SM2_3_26]|nr:hypothetical protein [Coleofasciculaceae cyanobacterium SM2_3_26]
MSIHWQQAIAVGQYLIYRSWLARKHPTWTIYLALSVKNARAFQQEPLSLVAQDYGILLVTVDVENERIVSWE